MAAGEFQCPDPTGTALRLTALLDGLAVQMTAYDGVSRARAEQWVDAALAAGTGAGAGGVDLGSVSWSWPSDRGLAPPDPRSGLNGLVLKRRTG